MSCIAESVFILSSQADVRKMLMQVGKHYTSWLVCLWLTYISTFCTVSYKLERTTELDQGHRRRDASLRGWLANMLQLDSWILQVPSWYKLKSLEAERKQLWVTSTRWVAWPSCHGENIEKLFWQGEQTAR